MQHEPAATPGAGLPVGERQQLGRDATAAGRGAHRETAELDGRPDEQQPAGGEHLVTGDRDEMDCLAVASVELLARGHALLDAEHLVAQREQLAHLLLGGEAADLDRGGVGHRTVTGEGRSGCRVSAANVADDPASGGADPLGALATAERSGRALCEDFSQPPRPETRIVAGIATTAIRADILTTTA
jgi:hypothetical protein